MLGFRDGSGTSTSVLIATFQKGRIAQASCQVAFFGYVWRTIFFGTLFILQMTIISIIMYYYH